jgi:hypothetical protein
MKSIYLWEKIEGIDFWKRGPVANVMVQPEAQNDFEHFLQMNRFGYKVLIENVQETLDREEEEKQQYLSRKSTREGVDFEHFWEYDEIVEYIENLERKYPQLVKTYDLGRTYENRTIKGISISRNGELAGKNPVVLMDSGIHAR